MASASLPGGANGQAPVGFGSIEYGLKVGSTVYGSSFLPLDNANVTPVSITFDTATLATDGITPLELHFRVLVATTQNAAYFATSLGVAGGSDLTTRKRRMDATGYTYMACYSLFLAGGTIYLLTDADLGATAVLDYFMVYGRAASGAVAV